MGAPARQRAVLSLALVAMLAGCASLTEVPPPLAPLTPVTGDPAFALTGRLAIRQGEQAISANLRWRYDGTSETMLISGPLGAGSAELERDSTGVTLRSRGQIERAASAEMLMRDALGFALPLDGLRYWVRGQAAPGGHAVNVSRDSRGRLDAFHESGWEVAIPVYTAAPLDSLPRRVDVESTDLRVRLIIDQWVEAPMPVPPVELPADPGRSAVAPLPNSR